MPINCQQIYYKKLPSDRTKIPLLAWEEKGPVEQGSDSLFTLFWPQFTGMR